MIKRQFWLDSCVHLLKQKNLLWLSGVRRVGKTTLCHQIDEIEYFDCELPSVRFELEDPEFFWKQRDPQKIVVLDEVHRLSDPSNVLKIVTDHYKKLKVIATGSSTLLAKSKFKDTLTDRKRNLWVQPLLLSELNPESLINQFDKRLLRGGLPPAYLSADLDDQFYAEWLDSFWSKDVQELFVVEKKTGFLKLAELILRHSGELFEASRFAETCELSRQTVMNYLQILEVTLFAIVLRPFSTGRANDILSMPKVYGFDTGFVCFARGWLNIRPEDRGVLTEHLVLSELLSKFRKDQIFYWRDKQKNEVDFVLKPSRGQSVHAIECKSNHKNLDLKGLKAFRRAYPEGRNFIIAPSIHQSTNVQKSGLDLTFLPVNQNLLTIV